MVSGTPALKKNLLTGASRSKADAESPAPAIIFEGPEHPSFRLTLGYLHGGLLLRLYRTSTVTSYPPMDSRGGFGAQIGLNSQQSLLRRVLN